MTKFNCAQCHGADFKSPIDPAYPNLAGQHRDYLQHALIAYKRGGEGTNGRAHAIMVPEARKLSNQDIENIAAYLASLPGTLVLKKYTLGCLMIEKMPPDIGQAAFLLDRQEVRG